MGRLVERAIREKDTIVDIIRKSDNMQTKQELALLDKILSPFKKIDYSKMWYDENFWMMTAVIAVFGGILIFCIV